MRILAVPAFARCLKSLDFSAADVRAAIEDMNNGLVHANLGSGLFKQRVARPGTGKRGGHRIVLAFRAHDRAILLYGFPKAKRATLSKDETAALKKLAAKLLAYDASQIARALQSGALVKLVEHDEFADNDPDQTEGPIKPDPGDGP
ncbi:type II toxin-antitoxin system RelE/ParE family toxin [Roseospira goensis]|uniref:Type II toxin-antitoxin system RelE/ParE family toxin n=1 Tax=Roseospira goensis TaxID=391922 RepID=A0A7W6RZN1_9PROT|nr:type II toxin-antitoxin system RelE/ParE family toxin [Roseospira goensis]MBB4285670.1 hypothetical protein [Roseospira goensis]